MPLGASSLLLRLAQVFAGGKASCCRNAPGGIQSTSTDQIRGIRVPSAAEVVMPLGASSLLLR